VFGLWERVGVAGFVDVLILGACVEEGRSARDGPSKSSPEFREEAVRMYRESGESIAAVARRLGLGPETFRRWVREDEVERGLRDGTTREEHAEIVKLRREVRRLEEEKLILQKAAAYFARETGRLP
jgi:transposase